MSTFKKVGSIAVRVLLWIIILIAALFAFTTLVTHDSNKVAGIAGYTPMTVLTDSMSPTFNHGDMIIIKKCDPDTLQVGDIVTFHTIIENEYALNTHRIIDIIESPTGLRTFTTKGDNNVIADQRSIVSGDIVGRYTGRIPYIGYVMQFLSSSIGFLIVIVLPLLVFFIFQVYHLVVVSIKLKKAVAAEAAIEAAEAASSVSDEKTLAAEQARKEAEAALEEARRLKAEAEAALAKAKAAADDAAEKATDAVAETAEKAADAAAEAAETVEDAADAAQAVTETTDAVSNAAAGIADRIDE